MVYKKSVYFSLMCNQIGGANCWCVPTERSTGCNIILVNLSAWRYKSVYSFSIALEVGFLNAVLQATWHYHVHARCDSGAIKNAAFVGEWCIDGAIEMQWCCSGPAKSSESGAVWDLIDLENIVDACLACKIYL